MTEPPTKMRWLAVVVIPVAYLAAALLVDPERRWSRFAMALVLSVFTGAAIAAIERFARSDGGDE